MDRGLRNTTFDTERATRKRTFTLLSDRKDWVQQIKQGGRPSPRARSLWKRAECQTESKALDKQWFSKQFGLKDFLLEAIPDTLQQDWSIVDFDLPGRKPAW